MPHCYLLVLILLTVLISPTYLSWQIWPSGVSQWLALEVKSYIKPERGGLDISADSRLLLQVVETLEEMAAIPENWKRGRRLPSR